MTNREHDHWIAQLSDHLNGDLGRADARALEHHLAGCVSCRAVRDDLADIVARARALPDVAPSRDLWPGIRSALANLEEDGSEAQVIRFPGSGARATRGFWMTLPQLAAAAVVLLVVSVSATWWAGAGVASRVAGSDDVGPSAPATVTPAADVAAPSPGLARDLSTLEQLFARSRGALDPNTVRILDKNLGVIQRAIDESVDALAVDPGNAFLKDHLERTYREKADFLREVTTMAAWEG
jgi:hypothetical protein